MAEKKEKPIYAVAGPTASGKTALAVRLALHLKNAEIINFDSVQIYQGIEIATAKPTVEEMCGVPHHLIDYVPPERNYTAADWARDAAEKIREIEARGARPVLVGGTGFYLRTLSNPFFESPPTDENLRARLKQLKEKKGAEHLHRLLQRVDPRAAEKLFPRDYVRSMRALEVFFQTGRRISEVQPERKEPPEFAGRIKTIVLNPPRAALYEKINRRAEMHFERGLVEEVRRLRAAGLRDDTNALGAHGYRRVCEYLRGERSLESAVEQTKQDVRRYAKRQLTWFRRETGALWLDGFGDEPETFEKLVQMIES
jgi:tRNA dimethylallyltransferase